MVGFDLVLFGVAGVAGAVASVAGFGIGSILTPLLALQVGTKIAVAAISIPHFVATVIRFWIVRRHVDRKVLAGFGVASAVGGLAGALLHNTFHSAVLTYVFGGLLVFAGFMGMTGLAQKMRFHGAIAWVAGSLSGAFGGLVGNQGGIRSAALQAFDLPKQTLVATATAIGVIVDLARMPVYLVNEYDRIWATRWPILVALAGVTLGTWVGIRFLHGISEKLFRRILGALIFLLGSYMIFK